VLHILPRACRNVDIRATYRDHIPRNKTNAASPFRGRLVQHVVHAEALVLGRERVQVLLEQDVLGRDVGEDEVDLGPVAGRTSADDGAHDLQHGRDAGAAGDHAKVADHVGLVHEGALGALEADGLADGEAGHVLADVAGGVRLDEQVEVARLVVAADRGVGADNLLGVAVLLGDGGADGDVLADGEAEYRVRGRQVEAVDGDIVGDDGLFLEFEFLEDVWLEDLFGFCASPC